MLNILKKKKKRKGFDITPEKSDLIIQNLKVTKNALEKLKAMLADKNLSNWEFGAGETGGIILTVYWQVFDLIPERLLDFFDVQPPYEESDNLVAVTTKDESAIIDRAVTIDDCVILIRDAIDKAINFSVIANINLVMFKMFSEYSLIKILLDLERILYLTVEKGKIFYWQQ